MKWVLIVVYSTITDGYQLRNTSELYVYETKPLCEWGLARAPDAFKRTSGFTFISGKCVQRPVPKVTKA